MPRTTQYDNSHLNAWIEADYPNKHKRGPWAKFYGAKQMVNGKLITKDGKQIVAKDDDQAILKSLYFDPKTGFMGTKRLYSIVQQEYSGITRNDVARFLKSVEVHQQTRAPQRMSTVKPIVAKRPYQHIQVDLADMSSYSGHNDNYKWIFVAIDLFTKKVWAYKMTKKDVDHTHPILVKLLNDLPEKPTVLQSDNGGEFVNEIWADELKTRDIRHITSLSHTPQSQGSVERFNRTIKTKLKRYFLANETRRWIDVLDDLVEGYNNSKHLTTGKIPNRVEDSPKEEKEAKDNIMKNAKRMIKNNDPHFELEIGDKVRILLREVDYKVRAEDRALGKSFEPRWSKELYTIKQVARKKNPLLDSGKYYKLVEWPQDKLFHRSRLLWSPPEADIVRHTPNKTNRPKTSRVYEAEEPTPATLRKRATPVGKQQVPQPDKPKVPRVKQTKDIDLNDEDVFEVDKIVAQRRKGNRIEYRVRWKGYKESDDTWQLAKDINKTALDEWRDLQAKKKRRRRRNMF